jgi:replication initiation protein RepC
MQREYAPGAQRGAYAGAPTGFRRLTPSLLQADRAAERFDGLPEEVEVHGQLLAAFKAAAPRLGLSVRLVHALDWLFRFTWPQDWEQGARPIVWPSAAMQREALGLSESQVKSVNRGLIDAGLITMKDSPNGKRYGVRERQGRIVEAYGFDLSPIASRYAEFVRLAAEAKAERALIGQLRRRATIARKGIVQILETVAEYGSGGEEWSRLRH